MDEDTKILVMPVPQRKGLTSEEAAAELSTTGRMLVKHYVNEDGELVTEYISARLTEE